MLLRCIMTVLLLIATAMPAWANAQEQELPPEIQELIKAGVELYEEEVLQNLRIEIDDQLQGDTYTLTYTADPGSNYSITFSVLDTEGATLISQKVAIK